MRRHETATEEVRLASQSEDELEEEVLMLAWSMAKPKPKLVRSGNRGEDDQGRGKAR